MKLYHFPVSPNSRKVLAVIYHLGLECERQVIDLFQGEQMRPDFVRLNPNHMIPTLVDGDYVLWESNAIMQYLCSRAPGHSLWPLHPQVQADISRWLFWQTAHWGSACGILIYERLAKEALNLGKPDPGEISKGEERFRRFAQVLDQHLEGRKWLVGDQLTLADFSVGSLLDLAGPAGYPVRAYGEIQRWYAGIEAVEAWKRSAPAAVSGLS